MFRFIIFESIYPYNKFLQASKKYRYKTCSCFWKKQSKLRSDTKVYQLHSVVCQTFELWYWLRPVWRVGRLLTLVRSWCYLKEYFLLSFLCWSRMFYNNYRKFNVQCLLYGSIYEYIYFQTIFTFWFHLLGKFFNPTNAKEKLLPVCLNLTLAIKKLCLPKAIIWHSCKKIIFRVILFREEGQPSVIFLDIAFLFF